MKTFAYTCSLALLSLLFMGFTPMQERILEKKTDKNMLEKDVSADDGQLDSADKIQVRKLNKQITRQKVEKPQGHPGIGMNPNFGGGGNHNVADEHAALDDEFNSTFLGNETNNPAEASRNKDKTANTTGEPARQPGEKKAVKGTPVERNPNFGGETSIVDHYGEGESDYSGDVSQIVPKPSLKGGDPHGMANPALKQPGLSKLSKKAPNVRELPEMGYNPVDDYEGNGDSASDFNGLGLNPGKNLPSFVNRNVTVGEPGRFKLPVILPNEMEHRAGHGYWEDYK